MEKGLIDRRIQQMEIEGVIFRPGMHVGVDVTVERLMDDYDLLVLAGGAELPRGLPVPGTGFELRADLVLLAIGFTGPRLEGAVLDSGVALTPQGNVSAPFGDYQTSNPRIFACGDMRRGQSLVVWAIREGRDCAAKVDAVLAAEAKVRPEQSTSS